MDVETYHAGSVRVLLICLKAGFWRKCQQISGFRAATPSTSVPNLGSRIEANALLVLLGLRLYSERAFKRQVSCGIKRTTGNATVSDAVAIDRPMDG